MKLNIKVHCLCPFIRTRNAQNIPTTATLVKHIPAATPAAKADTIANTANHSVTEFQ